MAGGLPQFMPARLPRRAPALGEGELHLWRLHMPSARQPLALPLHSLSADERQRAARLVFEVLRSAWQAARALQRVVLAAYLGCPPEALRFQAGPGGKPLLAGAGLHFNLSHSGDAVLLAVSRRLPCGVDLEALRPGWADPTLADACLGPRERAAWQRLRPAQRPRALLQAWTRKEAWLKCTGQGLRKDPRTLEMPWLSQRLPHDFVTPSEAGQVTDLQLGAAFVGALVTPGPPQAPRCHCLGWPSA